VFLKGDGKAFFRFWKKFRRIDPMSELKRTVGETAGKVWQTLSADGPQTLAQLKKKVNGSSELVNFALGWLAREDKIDIVQEKKTYRAQLK
jgi:hypothetical protein